MIVGPYRTWLFDCDGVLLDSNKVKTAAFHRLVLPFGEDIARTFVDYHVAHGGVSRTTKLRYLYERLLDRPAEPATIEALARDFGELCRAELLACPETPGLREFLARRPTNSRSFVVSGADEVELRELLAMRGLAASFDGIYGSPRTKVQILTELAGSQPLAGTAVFIGDSQYDHEAATQLGIDFVFISGCSELADWRTYVAERGLRTATTLGELQPR